MVDAAKFNPIGHRGNASGRRGYGDPGWLSRANDETIIVAMVEEIHKATGMVWDLSNEKQIHEAIVRISNLENEADALYFNVIADLFNGRDGRNPVEILKWKEVYQGLEDACDQCKDFTHVLGNVVIKNA